MVIRKFSLSVLLVWTALGPNSAAAQESLNARAVVVATERATLSSELTANVIELPFTMGTSFSKGNPLVKFDCVLYEAQAHKVRAEVSLAKARVENAEQLSKLGSIGAYDLAQAKGELARAQADLALARINTDRCVIKAPFDGSVVELFIKEHEKAEQQPLIEIVGSNGFRAEIVVPVSWSVWLKPGSTVDLVTDETNLRVSAEIASINPTVDTVSQTIKLIADLNEKDGVMAGMSATAIFAPPPSR